MAVLLEGPPEAPLEVGLLLEPVLSVPAPLGDLATKTLHPVSVVQPDYYQ